MNKIKSMTKLSICIALSVASYSASAAPSLQPTKAPENLAQNITSLVYHSAQLPVVAYKHRTIIGKLLRGEVVNPTGGIFGTIFSSTASLLNGDLGKLITLSGELGPHFKEIQKNSTAIKTSVENSLPSAVVNLISNTPDQIYSTFNNSLNYVADATVEKSKIYQATKKMLEEKNKNIALQNNNIENQKKELAKQSKEIESVKNDLKVKIEELEAVKKELDVAQGKLAEIEQNEKVVATTQANDNLDINNTKVEPASISVSEELAENEKSVTTVVAPYINEQLENQKVAILATAQYMEKSAQIIANVHQDVAKLQHKYHQLQNTIQKNRHVSSRGIASIAAMSNIPVPAVAGKTTIGAGVGHFDRKNAIAIGASRYYENGTAVKVSLGTAGSNVAFGGGISYSF